MASTGHTEQGEGASKSDCGFLKSFLKKDFDSSITVSVDWMREMD